MTQEVDGFAAGLGLSERSGRPLLLALCEDFLQVPVVRTIVPRLLLSKGTTEYSVSRVR